MQKLSWDEISFKLAEPVDKILGVTLFDGVVALENIREFQLSKDGEVLVIRRGWAKLKLDFDET